MHLTTYSVSQKTSSQRAPCFRGGVARPYTKVHTAKGYRPAVVRNPEESPPRQGVSPTTRCDPSLDRKLGNQENGRMKTTLDLPDALVKEVKLRAVHNGRKLKDAVADLLRLGLNVAMNTPTDGLVPVVTTDKKTGLPLIKCKQAAS